MVSKPSFDTHESPKDVEGRPAAILNRDRRLTVLVGVYEADFARHAFTLSVLERAWAAKLGWSVRLQARWPSPSKCRPVCFQNGSCRLEPWSMLTTLWNGSG